ncbi:MAG: hypothetical protein EA392_09380 [Cryomorphaceae bacterium]|nr:MAG: hypothetical protein EA392_09380 [Cryomorphaceae bacterium]
MKTGKRRVMVSFERLPETVRNELKKKYPDGFQEHLVCMTDHRNNTIHVLRHETAESSYLIKFENYKAQIAHFLGNFKDFNEKPDETEINSD